MKTKMPEAFKTTKYGEKTQYYISLSGVVAEFGMDEEELRSLTASNPDGTNVTEYDHTSSDETWYWFMNFRIGDARNAQDSRGWLTAASLLLFGRRVGDEVEEARYRQMAGFVGEA
jgi:hypothetical protein